MNASPDLPTGFQKVGTGKDRPHTDLLGRKFPVAPGPAREDGPPCLSPHFECVDFRIIALWHTSGVAIVRLQKSCEISALLVRIGYHRG